MLRERAVFDYLNPSVAKRKAHLVDNSIRRLIDQQYTKHKGEVIATLKRAPGKIHIPYRTACTALAMRSSLIRTMVQKEREKRMKKVYFN